MKSVYASMYSIALRLCCNYDTLQMHYDAQLYHKLSAVAHLVLKEAQRTHFVAIMTKSLKKYHVEGKYRFISQVQACKSILYIILQFILDSRRTQFYENL